MQPLFFSYQNLSTKKKPEQMFQNEGQQYKPQEWCFAWEIKSGYKERRVRYSAADGL